MENINIKKYLFYLVISLALTTIGAFIGGYLPIVSKYIALYAILSFVVLFIFIFSRDKTKKISFYVFSFVEGLTLSPIIALYTKTSLFGCILITLITVCIFSVIGMKMRDLSFLGGILFILLLAGLIYSIVALFIPLPALSLLFIVLFCGYVMYDINVFKRVSYKDMDDDEILSYVMDIYLDIINIFIEILRLVCDDD